MNWLNKNLKIVIYIIIFTLSFFFTVNLFAEEEKSKGNAYNKLKVFSEIRSLIESIYVDPTKNDLMIDGALNGMV